LHIQDKERRRLARELHDDLGQQLVGLKMMTPQGVAGAELNKYLDTAISTVRNLSYLLHPPLLDETGLRAALHWFVEGMVKRSNIEIALSITPTIFPRLSPDIETTIFRVVQESLTNVYRHSKSESARVEVDKQADSVIVRVRDYGKGVTTEVAGKIRSPHLGVGIGGMRERVRQFGGDLTVSRAQPGTLVEAHIPIFGSELT
jgi:two-component system, NarL family, sensor kinase